MPKSFSRTDRISDALHQCIARVLQSDFKDPRIGLVTVLGVKVTPDLRHAKIYVSVLETTEISKTLEILNKAAGFFRSEIAHRLKLRITPQPHFVFDDSTHQGNRIEHLLHTLHS